MADNSDEKTMGMLAHLLGIFTGFIGPLVIFLIRQEKKGIGYENAKNALNFQIMITIAYIVGSILLFIVIGGFVMLAAGILSLVFGIMGTMKANEGQVYQYPFTLHLIK